MTDDDPRSQIYRNVKTGQLYIVIHWTAFLMDDPYGDYIILKSLKDGSVWVRKSDKFLGRDYDFECVTRDELLKLAPESEDRRRALYEKLKAEFEGKPDEQHSQT